MILFTFTFRHSAAVHCFPVCDFTGEARLAWGLGYCAAEGQRRGLAVVEAVEGRREVAIERCGLRVAVSVGQRGGEPLRVARNAEQPDGCRPLVRIVAISYLREVQLHLRGRAVGARCEVQRPCRSAQRALDGLYPVRSVARRFDDKGQFSYLLPHDGSQRVVCIRFSQPGVLLMYAPLPAS